MILSSSGKLKMPLLSSIGEDGSETFFNSDYNEAYHSKIGAITEAEYKFVKPSSLEKLLLNNNKEIRILDLFFGLGYNTGISIDFAYKIKNNPGLQITAIEKDLEIISKIKELKVPKWYKKWQNILYSLSKKPWVQFENINIQLHLDSIFNLIDKLREKSFDVIFFDPFSHKVTPEFWTDDFLISIFKLLDIDGTFTTYSGLKRVEKLALENNFEVKRIPAIGRKKSSLLLTRRY